MSLLFISFLAGILTVLAPCSFTLLPIVIGGSGTSKSKLEPLVIVASLAFSIIVFSLLLKGTTLFLDVDRFFWQVVSGSILIILAIFMFFPQIWDKINVTFNLSKKSDQLLEKSVNQESITAPMFLGLALGPVFSSCSPTYALVVATILPVSFFEGLLNILAYTLGLSIFLLIIAYTGQTVVKKMKWAVNPNGIFKKIVAVIIFFVGIAILTGADKNLQEYLLSSGNLDWLINLESGLIE